MVSNKCLDVNFDLKNLSVDGRFKGYASVFGVVDKHNDIIVKGAFNKVLDSKQDIKLLWQHKFDEPIGYINEIYEDDNGLFVDGRLLFSVQRAKEAYDLLKHGALSGLSIGYVPKEVTYEKETRYITEADLWEVSVVTFPANEFARIHEVKNNKKIINNTEPQSIGASLKDLCNSITNAIGAAYREPHKKC